MTQQSSNSKDRPNLLAELIQNVQLAWRLLLDPRVSIVSKALIPILGILYLIVPVDFIPDVIPGLGQLDDVAVMLLLMRLFISLAPTDVVEQLRATMASPGGPGGQRTTGGQSGSRQGSAPRSQAAGAGRDDVVDAEYRILDDD